MKRLFGLLVAGAIACGPGPEVRDGRPSGTLVVVIRQGPDRVPFHPGLARIQGANAQLAKLLGHSIAIEMDGALLPQTHDAAEEEIAHLVEDVAADVDALAKEDAAALAWAREHFQRLVVRYDPAEAERRRDRWNRHSLGKLDPATGAVDVVRAEAAWRALDRGEVGSVLYQGFAKTKSDRFASVLPDALPASERGAWLHYHTREAHPAERFASVDLVTVRGCLQLAAGADVALAKEARAWLFGSGLDAFSQAYYHHAAEVETAKPGSPFRVTEGAFVTWLRDQLHGPATVEERGKVANKLWVIDFRKPDGDRFATYAFPGIDPMAFALGTADAWIAAGHPTKTKLYDDVVQPVVVESHDGETRFDAQFSSDAMFYRWALADRTREDALVKGLLQRPDTAYATAVFVAAHRTQKDEAAYLRFLQRFEGAPAQWKIGAEVHRVTGGGGDASTALVEESKRLWRDVPAARGYALYWFAVQAEHSYHAAADWKDDLQGRAIDDASFRDFLGIGWPAYALLPTVWPALAKKNRVRPILAVTPVLLDAHIRARPGAHDVAGTLADVARLLCEERSSESAELRAWATAEQPKRPGEGLAAVVTDAQCKTGKQL